MSTTIRIRSEDKRRLQELQEAWAAATGERPTLQGLLSRALDYLERHREAFMGEAAWQPLSSAEIRAVEARLQADYGDWSVSDIDEIVYGEP